MAGRKKHTSSGPVEYESRFVRIKPFHDVEVDMTAATEMLLSSLVPNALSHASPKGSCYDCGRRVSGARKLCGPCLYKRQEERVKNNESH